jgi:uncharacterized protein (DUF362 family)
MMQSDAVISQIQADCAEISRAGEKEPRSISRRRFLGQASRGLIGAGLALSGAKTAFGQARSSAQAPTVAELEAPRVPVVEVVSEKAWQGDALDTAVVGEMLDRAMTKLTGFNSAKEAWRAFVLPSDIVGIKVNPIGGPHLSTHRVLVDKIIEGLYSAGVLYNQIIIWDRFEAHLIAAGYEINQSTQGVRCFASDSEGVGYDDEVYYETEKDVPVRRENGSIRSRYTRLLEEVTVLINAPVLKHHGVTGVSGCLKNLAFGGVDNTSRFHSNPLNCDPAIADIFAHRVIKDKLVLNIVDGLLGAFDGGPTYDPNGVWKYGGILASEDPVALDQMIYQIIEEKRKDLTPVARLVKYIRTASRAGLGTNNLDEMDYQQVKV